MIVPPGHQRGIEVGFHLFCATSTDVILSLNRNCRGSRCPIVPTWDIFAKCRITVVVGSRSYLTTEVSVERTLVYSTTFVDLLNNPHICSRIFTSNRFRNANSVLCPSR